ncbi:hypothetical protein RI129_004293 [Pyrocoelia pectoralis]|uniref:CRAL-TRIO domain-containing protein n=1 Tax=Pyrocoelia pectoralis TaxID=417401 RepID=A0AAN7VL51_9COLE
MNNFGFNVNEVIEKNRTTIEDIEHIEEWLTTETLPKLAREQIIAFLISCDNDRKMTKRTIKCNYALKSSSPDLFTNRNIRGTELENILNVIHGCEIPHRLNGYLIGISKLNDTNYRNFNLVAYIKLVTMSLETICFRENVPEGLILILDCKGFSLMHLSHVKINILKWFLQYVQEAIPIKLKSIHVVNSSSAIEVGFNLIKPFIRNETIQNVHFHSLRTMEFFYENHIPKSYLPKDYGGELEAVSYYHEQSLERLNRMHQYFEFEEQQRYKDFNFL